MTVPCFGGSKRQTDTRGFSLLELLVTMVVLTVIMGAMMEFMSVMQRRYTAQQRVGSVNQTGKTVMELLALDIEQAGYPGTVNTTTTAAVTASNSYNTTVTLASDAGLFRKRAVLVDTGANQETVVIELCTSTSSTSTSCTVGGSNSITGLFKKSHASGVPVRASAYPYPQGIVNTATYPSNATTLRIMGDLRGNGSLRYIEYRYTADATGNCQGTLVRSDSDAFATTQQPAATIADNLCNNAATGIFAYTTDTAAGTYTYFTQIGATLVMRTATSSAQERGAGGTATEVMREQYFVPRNVMYARRLAMDGLETLLPAAPSTVLSTLPAAP